MLQISCSRTKPLKFGIRMKNTKNYQHKTQVFCISMKSRRLKPIWVRRFWNFLKLRFIHHPLLKIPFCICYGNKAYCSIGSIQKLASYTKNQDEQWKLLRIAVFQTPLFTCLEPIGRSFDIRINEFSKYRCFYQNKVFFAIFNYYEHCYEPKLCLIQGFTTKE